MADRHDLRRKERVHERAPLPCVSTTALANSVQQRRQRATSACAGAGATTPSAALPRRGELTTVTTKTAPSLLHMRSRTLPLRPGRALAGTPKRASSATTAAAASGIPALATRSSSALVGNDVGTGDTEARDATDDQEIRARGGRGGGAGSRGGVGVGVGGGHRYAEGPCTRMNMFTAVNAGIRTAMETDDTAVRGTGR